MPTTYPRQTGLLAQVVDNHLNDWEDFAGVDINIPATYQPVDTTGDDNTDQAHWSYRGQAAVCALQNGNIVRIRLGDWTNTSERRIERQVITDPADPSQWVAWSWLSYGDNYAVAIERDDAAPAGYRIYHAKSDGLYRDNVRIYNDASGPVIVRIKTVYNQPHMLYLAVLGQEPSDTMRVITWYYIADVTSPGLVLIADCGNWHHYHQDIAVMRNDTSSTFGHRFRARPDDDAERDPAASDSLICELVDWSTLLSYWGPYNTYGNDFPMRGPSNGTRSGFVEYNDLYITQLSDPDYGQAWYLFYTEHHEDAFGNALGNLKNPIVFSRAPVIATTDPPFMSQATPLGFSIWGFAGLVESNGYVYLCGNGRVLRRPTQATSVEVTDYIMQGDYDLPRDNGAGTGSLTCPNPNNELGLALGLASDADTSITERRLDFSIGYKRPNDNVYTFKTDARWYVSALLRDRTNGVSRLIISISDFWHRLANPFRDAWRIPGQFDYQDWQPDAVNQLNNYSNPFDEMTVYNPGGADPATLPRLRASTSGQGPLTGTVCLYAGWRGANGTLSAMLWATTGGGLVFRYLDEFNYYLLAVDPTGTYLHICTGTSADDADDQIFWYSQVDAAKFNPAGTPIEVDFRYSKIEITVNDTLIGQVVFTDYHAVSGFTGLWAPLLVEASNLALQDTNWLVTSQTLIRMLLAYVDEHDVMFESDEESLNAPVFDKLLGPQSDWNTPEKAMRDTLEASKLNIVWRQDAD